MANHILRTDAAALINEDVVNEIIQNMPEKSAAMRMFRRVTMATNQQRMPVLAALPTAYWVNGDTGQKKTSTVSWENKYLNAEEIAVIVPIPENVLDDASFDVWGEVRPRIEEAIAVTLDAAIFFGTNAPSSFPTNIASAAVSAGNYEESGTTAQGSGGIAQDINIVMGKVEEDGFDVNGFVTTRAYKTRLRAARDTTGQQLFDVKLNTLFGEPVTYGLRGMWPTGSGAAELFAADWSQFILAIRKDITYKLLTESVIQDTNGNIIYNLAQQDMVGLRVTFRAAWQVANYITPEQTVAANRYPAGVLNHS